MDYMIFCDESLSQGEFFSHFYGGVLVRSRDYNAVSKVLEKKKTGLNIYKNTQPGTGRGRWSVPYRHWKFVPMEFRDKEI